MRGARSVVAVVSLLLQGCAQLVVEPEPHPPPGRFSSRPGQPGLVIGAPRVSPDEFTDHISQDLARQTGFGLVVATDFARDRRSFAEAYQLQVKEVARGPLRLYVEIHGGSRQEAAGRIEIATVGVGRDEAWRLRTLFELIRDAHLRTWPGAPRLEILVEPLDPLHSFAGAKQIEVPSVPQQTFHIELPRVARSEGRQAYTEILAEFLREASQLLPTPRH